MFTASKSTSSSSHEEEFFYATVTRPHGLEQALRMENYDSLRSHATYHNRKSNVFYEIDGVKKTLVEWANQYNLPAALVSRRVRKNGMTPKEALTTPLTPRGQRHLGVKE